MQCPVCKSKKLLAPAEIEPGLRASRCGVCGGQFVKVENYLAWFERHGEGPDGRRGRGGEAEQARAFAPAEMPAADSGPGKLCPGCGAFLIRFGVGRGVGFHVDHCGRCGGVWLDAHEWDALKAAGLHDHLHLVFSEAWQGELRKQENAERYRRTVTDILDDKLAQSCSADDLTRLKEFKAWADAHPAKAELYGYLTALRDL